MALEKSPFQAHIFQSLKQLTQSQLLVRLLLSTYILFLLVLPLSALILVLLRNNWNEILERAFDPIAIGAYGLTLKMAFFAALCNTFFGFLITWVLTRYTFVGKKYQIGLLR